MKRLGIGYPRTRPQDLGSTASAPDFTTAAQDRRSGQTFFRLLVGVWTSVSLLSILVFNRSISDITLSTGAIVCILIGALSTLLFEATLIVLVIAFLKMLLSYKSSFVRALASLLLVCSGTLLSIFLLSILVSWNLFVHRLGFIRLSAVVSTLSDFPSTALFLTAREVRVLLAGLLIAAACSAVAIFVAPHFSPGEVKRLGRVLAVAGLSSVLFLRTLPVSVLGEPMAGLTKTLFELQLFPSATLLWGPVWYYDPTPLPPLRSALKSRYGLETFATRIDREERRQNILVFAIEALRADEVNHRVDGREVLPTIDHLAEQGIRFSHAYATGNESLYSMTSVISGLYPLKFDHRDRYDSIDYPLLRIYDLLSPVYSTAFVSSANEHWQNMIAISQSPNLDYFFHSSLFGGMALPIPAADSGAALALAKGQLHGGNVDDATTTDHLQHWLQSTLDRDPQRPFFAMVSYQASHYPYEQGFHVSRVFIPDDLAPAEEASLAFFNYPRELRERMRNRYWNSLSYIDGLVASTLHFLEERGVLENTIIVIFGDHGEMFHENGTVTHASRLYNKTLHVALVVSGADKYPHGEYSAPVSLVDLGPLILDLASLPSYDGFQGRVPPGLSTLHPTAAEQFHPSFCTTQNIVYEDSVIVGAWKYIADHLGTEERLYNLDKDPLEVENLAAAHDLSTLQRCLRETLHDFRMNEFAYYASPQLKSSFFPPRYELSAVWCAPTVFAAADTTS